MKNVYNLKILYCIVCLSIDINCIVKKKEVKNCIGHK